MCRDDSDKRTVLVRNRVHHEHLCRKEKVISVNAIFFFGKHLKLYLIFLVYLTALDNT